MGAREKPEPIEGQQVDKVYERKLAELIGTTPKALERKRQRGVLPPGVWEKIDGCIMYSLERYNEWAESQWGSPKASRSLGAPSASASHGRKSDVAKRSPILKRPRDLQQQQVYELR
tara:strand:- start:16351 stop:16701 length:351 start_codon:yes stop_codon:yes gene_type:complete